MENIKLGDKVKDKITGLTGIAIGITNWLYGCRRITIQPQESKDGKPADAFTVDEPQLEILEERVITPFETTPETTRPHGIRPDASRRSDVKR